MKIFLDANICLDLLDTKRPTSKESVEWYMLNKDNENNEFYFSSDFITTFYYILTQKRKHNSKDTIIAIDALSSEIIPLYMIHSDFISAKNNFFEGIMDDFEDLIVLNSADRFSCNTFITNDKELLALGKFNEMNIVSCK